MKKQPLTGSVQNSLSDQSLSMVKEVTRLAAEAVKLGRYDLAKVLLGNAEKLVKSDLSKEKHYGHAMVKGKWHRVLNIHDNGVPAQQGGGNLWTLEGFKKPVHQDHIEDHDPMMKEAPVKKSLGQTGIAVLTKASDPYQEFDHALKNKDFNGIMQATRRAGSNGDNMLEQMVTDENMPLNKEHLHQVLNFIQQARTRTPYYGASVMQAIAQHPSVEADHLNRMAKIEPDDQHLAEYITSHSKYQPTPEHQGLLHASKFWQSYERKVDPHHFAAVKSLISGQPEEFQSHRQGDTHADIPSGHSHAQKYITHEGNLSDHQESSKGAPLHEVIPHLDAYAKETQKQLMDDKFIEKRHFNGKPHVKVFRGVAGNYSDTLRNKAGYDPATHSVEDKFVTVKNLPFSSWSTDPSVAGQFARREIEGQPHKNGTVVSAWMPVENALHSGAHTVLAGQEHAHPHEAEIVFKHTTPSTKLDTARMSFVRPEHSSIDEPEEATLKPVVPKPPKMQKSEQLEKGQNGDWQKEGYEIRHDLENNGGYVTVSVHKDGKQIGELSAGHSQAQPEYSHVVTVKVHPEHQRKGLATAMYQRAEEQLGKPFKPASSQSKQAKGLWKQKQRPFGKSEQLKKGQNGDWQKEGHTFKHASDSKANPYAMNHVYAYDKEDRHVGTASYASPSSDNSKVEASVKIHPEHQRKGLATEMYRLIEKQSGKSLRPGTNGMGQVSHSKDAQGLRAQPKRPFGKSEQLEKGSLQRKMPFNPADIPGKDKTLVSDWQHVGDNEAKDQIPRQEGNERARALHKLAGQTAVKKGAKSGKRYFLLHRGMGLDEMMSTYEADKEGEVSAPTETGKHSARSSWTPDYYTAISFARTYGEAGQKHNATPVSAWVHEDHIHHVPNQTGSAYKAGPNNWVNEKEIILSKDHSSKIAQPDEVRKHLDNVPHWDSPSVDQRINARSKEPHKAQDMMRIHSDNRRDRAKREEWEKSETLVKGEVTQLPGTSSFAHDFVHKTSKGQYHLAADKKKSILVHTQTGAVHPVKQKTFPGLQRALEELNAYHPEELNKAEDSKGMTKYDLGDGYSLHHRAWTEPGGGSLGGWGNPRHYWEIQHQDKTVGKVLIDRSDFHDKHHEGMHISHSVIDKPHRGKGLGQKTYKTLADHYGSLASDTGKTSNAANRVWDKLNAKKEGVTQYGKARRLIEGDPLKPPVMWSKDLEKSYRNEKGVLIPDTDNEPHPEKPYQQEGKLKTGERSWFLKPQLQPKHDKEFERQAVAAYKNFAPVKHLYLKMMQSVLKDPDRHAVRGGVNNTLETRSRHILNALANKEGYSLHHDGKSLFLTAPRHSKDPGAESSSTWEYTDQGFKPRQYKKI